MMRRTTLGTVSAASLNTRASVGPSRIQKQQVGGNARYSMMPARGSRPSSIGGKRRSSVFGKPTAAVMKDPRPTSEKGFMMKSIRNLISFLTRHGFEQTITPKQLMAPSTKDFLHILEFLVRQIDPNFHIDGKIEEEVPLLFKTLNYPFNIGKRSLLSVGSPHTWPTLLAALQWLVELLIYEEEVDTSKPESSDSEQGEEIFFEYLARAYVGFLAGEDDCSDLDGELSRNFEERNAVVRQDIERLEAELEEINGDLSGFKKNPNRLLTLENTRKDFVKDIDKFKKLIQRLEQHQEQLTKKLAERKKDALEKEQDMQTAVQRKQKLHEILENQELNQIDAQKIARERQTTQQSLRSATVQREEAQKRQWDLDMELAKKTDELENIAHKYNTTGTRLRVVPQSAKHADSVKYEIDLNTEKSGPLEVLGIDYKGSVKLGLHLLREKIVQKHRDCKGDLLESEADVERMTDKVSDKEDAVNSKEDELKKVENQLKSAKVSNREFLKEIAEDMEKMEEDVRKLRALNVNSVANSNTEMSLVEQEYTSAVEKFESEKERMNNLVLQTLDLLTTHKQNIQDELADLEMFVKEKEDDLES